MYCLSERWLGETRNTWENHKRRQAPPSPSVTPLPLAPPGRSSDSLNAHPVVWGLPGRPGRGRTGQGGQLRTCWATTAQKMRSDVVLRKQLRFLQRLQKPTPSLPLHIFAAEGETAGNRSFPDVIGVMPTVLSGRHQGVGSGRAGWEVRQLWTKALGSLPREVRWGPLGSQLAELSPALNGSRRF